MHIHRISGRTLQDALRRARAAHGEDAVVLTQESTEVGVTIAVAERRAQPPAVPPRAEPARPATTGAEPLSRPDIADLARRLEATGCSTAFVRQVCEAVRESQTGGQHAIDVAAEVLGRAFTVQPAPKTAGRRHVLAFVGPTGVGKTTTIAKLGLRLVRAGRRVALATMDSFRVGAVEQLQAYADMIEVPFHAVRDGEGLRGVVRDDRHSDLVLLDTTGRSPFDAANLARLGAELPGDEADIGLDTYLVVSAASDAEGVRDAAVSFAPTRPSGLVLTKIDETRRPGAALERCLFTKLGFAFLCDGQEVAAHLHRPRGDHFVNLLLRGKLA